MRAANRARDARLPILHFTNSTVWGGVEEHICGLLRYISRDLFRARLVCSYQNYERFLDACPSDIEVTPLALDSPRHIAGAAKLARLLRQENCEIVHSHMFWSSLFAGPIAWTCRVPVVVETLHGSEAWRKGWKARCNLDRITTPFISKYVAVSPADAQFLAEKKRVSTDKIAMIHNGIDLRRFSASRDARLRARRSLGFQEDDVVVIMVARFHPGKGHSVLLSAMVVLLSMYTNLKLITLGEGDGERDFRRSCDELGITPHVRLAGFQSNVSEWLAAADINVLPSFYEGLPLTVLEAMASALPTVATDVGGIPEAIEDGISGILVPPGDAVKLANALSVLLNNRPMRERMGKAACTRANQWFGIERQVRATEMMYLELCGTRVGGPLAEAPLMRVADPVSSSSIPENL